MLPYEIQLAFDYWKSGERTQERMHALIIHVCDTHCIQGEMREHYINVALETIKKYMKG